MILLFSNIILFIFLQLIEKTNAGKCLYRHESFSDYTENVVSSTFQK